jgi:hypothetical protein
MISCYVYCGKASFRYWRCCRVRFHPLLRIIFCQMLIVQMSRGAIGPVLVAEIAYPSMFDMFEY